jgi:hypothetical protein
MNGADPFRRSVPCLFATQPPRMKTQLFCIAAGKPGGGTFLPKCTTTKSVAGAVGAPAKVNGWGPFFANDSEGYISYGTGQFDGQGSGHQFGGTVWHPTHGYNNNCDGGRSHWACDYRQA